MYNLMYNSRISEKFCNILVCDSLQLWKIPTVVGSIVVAGALMCCALLHSKCDLKTEQINMQHRLIQTLMRSNCAITLSNKKHY